jgi:hypothetical protein
MNKETKARVSRRDLLQSAACASVVAALPRLARAGLELERIGRELRGEVAPTLNPASTQTR